ncbi:hypothetical protein [Candidatus Neomicrothrix sp.]|uniref:hypothetical protein n=1 Tax=Candidatus Neomicrothrix sp. TaxID=2719034 RepID=UPI001B609536|nr:hypothetical protein [Candidatus Microthrix sp.]MBP6136578.1 hypothetical protein [Candidatus Microthrix sp.]MBP6151599.1 hypothetical protein [Candidatus Microthrix sp.]MCH9838097.1 hypothetical protein [bacterium]
MTITIKTFTAARAFSRGSRHYQIGDELSGATLRDLLLFDSVGDEPKFVATSTSSPNTKKEGSDHAADR